MAAPPDLGRLREELRVARRDEALAVLEGFHAVKHAVRFGAELVRVVAREGAELDELSARLAPDVVLDAERVADEVFARLVPVPPRTGVLAIARRPVQVVPVQRVAPAVVLEDPRDLSNVGACVRVAAAAGASAVLTTGSQDPWSPEALRGSAGLHFALPVVRVGEVTGRPIVALDPDGDPPTAIPDDALLAFGTERAGLSDALLARADARVALPMREGVSSLNLATAVSAVLYAWRLGRGEGARADAAPR
jgi:RNA methyltransferase, TrmH family